MSRLWEKICEEEEEERAARFALEQKIKFEEDDAPELTDEQLDRGAVYDGDKLIKPATGTLTRDFEGMVSVSHWGLFPI